MKPHPSKQSLMPSHFFHIFNRGNSGEKIFYREDNFRFFLKRFAYCLIDYIEVYAFCLMVNHFHFLVKLKSREDILKAIRKDYPNSFPENLARTKNSYSLSTQDLGKFVSKRFKNFFISYAKAINKQQQRHGSLFEHPFKKILITKDNHLKHLVRYIHNNPVKHGFVDKPEEWQWSSYNRFLITKKTQLKKGEVLDWFDGIDNFKLFHDQKENPKILQEFLID